MSLSKKNKTIFRKAHILSQIMYLIQQRFTFSMLISTYVKPRSIKMKANQLINIFGCYFDKIAKHAFTSYCFHFKHTPFVNTTLFDINSDFGRANEQ